MSDTGQPEPFPKVPLDAWREAVGKARLERTSLEGPTLQTLHTQRPDEARGRPGAPPFTRHAEPHGGAVLTFEIDRAARAVERARAAAAAGAERVRVGPRACAGLSEAQLAELVEACGEVELVLAAGPDAVAWALKAPASVPVLDDPLWGLLRDGQLPCGAERAIRRSVTRAAGAPGRCLEVDTRPYHDAGASPATEIALAAGTGLALLRAFVDVDHPLADAPRKLTFTFSVGPDVFVSTATLRAARWVWSKVLRTLGIDGPEQGMRIHATGSMRASSRLEPMNNALRGTASAFAAYAGGANEISVAPFDSLGQPSDAADRLALTTLHLLRWESQLGHVADPGGGSYHLESLTSSLARQAWTELQALERQGGVLAGVLDGSIAAHLATTAQARSDAAAHRKRAIVGASRYAAPEGPIPRAPSTDDDETTPTEETPPALPARSFEALASMQATTLDGLRRALRGPDAPVLDPLVVMRPAAPFEDLREASTVTRATLIAVGPPAALRARVDFARDALALIGITCDLLTASDPEDAKRALADDNGPLVCLAAPNEALPELVPVVVEAISTPLVVAAPPDPALEGVSAFLHAKMHSIETLESVLAALAPEEDPS